MKTLEEALAALEKATASIEALEAKNKELLSEKKTARQEADEAREAAEAAAEEKARAAKDVDAVEKAITKKFEKQIADLNSKNTTYETQLQTLLIDNAIKDGLTAANVAPQYQKAVTAMLKAEAKLENGEAVVNGVPLTDAIKSFVTSDEGRHFVAAPASSGTNAQGGKQASGLTMTKDTFNMTEFLSLAATNPEAANALADTLGMPHLKA